MPDYKQNNKRIAQNTIFLYLRMVVIMVITLFTTRKLFEVLGVEDFGLYNVVCGFVTMFSFLNTSMANGIQRFYNFEIGQNGEGGVAKIYTHALIIQVVMSAVILVAVESFGLWYLYHKMSIPPGRFYAACWIFQFAILQLLLVMLTVPFSAAIMAYERMNVYAIIGIIDAIFKLVIVYLISLSSIDRLIFYGGLMTVVSISHFLLNFSYCKCRLSNIVLVKNRDRTLFSKMLFFSGWNIFGSLSHMMQSQGVNLILNAFWGTIMNAANGVAHQINGAVNSLTSGFVTAVRPQMIKNYASGNIEYMKKMYYSVSKLTFYLVMILAVPLIGEIDTVLNIWLGKGKYPEITPIISQITIFMALCNSYATPTSIVIHATGEMKKFQLVVSSVTLMIIPIAYVAAKIGYSAPIIIFLNAIITILAQISRLIIVKEQVGFPIFDYVRKVFAPTLLVLGLSAGIVFLLRRLTPISMLWAIVRICLSGICSCLFIFLVGTQKSEKQLILSFIKRR